MKLSFSLFFLLVILSSCLEQKQESLLSELFKLESKTREALSVESLNDSDSLLLSTNLLSIIPDTISRLEALALDDYKRARTCLKENIFLDSIIQLLGNEQIKRYESLINDIEKGLGRRAKYKAYIKQEKKAFEEFNAFLERRDSNATYLNNYDFSGLERFILQQQ